MGWVVIVGGVCAGRFRAQQTHMPATKLSHFRTDFFIFIAIRSPSSNQGPVSCPGANLMMDDYEHLLPAHQAISDGNSKAIPCDRETRGGKNDSTIIFLPPSF
jgi:hypothetical protein